MLLNKEIKPRQKKSRTELNLVSRVSHLYNPVFHQKLPIEIADQKVSRIYQSRQQFGFVSLFNGISTFVGYLMPKPFL